MADERIMQSIVEKCDFLYDDALLSDEKIIEKYLMFFANQMIISKNPQFTGISARQQLEFTTHLLLTD